MRCHCCQFFFHCLLPDLVVTLLQTRIHPNMRRKVSSAENLPRLGQRTGNANLRLSLQLDSLQANSSLGAQGTFRSKALMKRMTALERRDKLIENCVDTQSESSSLLPTAKRYSSIPEEEEIHDEPISTVEIPLKTALKEIILGKRVSFLLVLMPFAVMAHHDEWSAKWVFWLNFFVMIPLAAILGDFTEEAALHTGETVGGLLNATFGNAVEVVVAIQALLANEIRVVQGSMLGSIFSNLLLVLGCCFFFGGIRYNEQSFNATNVSANMGLLALSSIALVLPTPYASYYEVEDEGVLAISRYAAIFLLFNYFLLLVFQLYTHREIPDIDDDGDEEEDASISLQVALLGLLITTLTVTVFSDYLVDSIDEFTEASSMSKTFVGLILLPIVGNAVEHITAVTVAMKDKMDLSMGVAVGSCTQISLFVVPVTVLVGWATGKPMTLNFPTFEITLYVLSIFTVSICTLGGKSNWLLGSLLITTYILIAIGFWFENVVDF